MSDFEKLGAFYLGKTIDSNRSDADRELLLYDAKDLTTHALCVGMTGSGKTGLCVGILEEAAIDGIPAIVIDPKGDIGNLMLTFPSLTASDFRPWIDESEALRKGQTPDEFASKTATMWREGLASWGQDASRIERLRSAADVSIYTPGSSAGLQITLLKSFAVPSAEVLGDADALRDRIMSAVSGLLALLGIEADPVQSREHILLSNILDNAWQKGSSLELADLIRAIMNPPFESLGVFDVETFYPASDRNALAMRLNNVLASPSFAAWMEGEQLDIASLLHTPSGKPKISILSISHLGEAERMFFVTLVLNEMISWMRQQSGTSNLRALLYMDEIFGYFPPSANPPSKAPMLTLLKQARAFGLGCILATQNPVDLDYKGLGNTGTWFIGRLQTERDKMRVLDGLEGASAAAGQAFSRAEIDLALSGLGKRVFLMNNVHDDAPVLFETRWVLSYLRGPLTKDHIATLMDPIKHGARSQVASSSGQAKQVISISQDSAPEAPSAKDTADAPVLPSGVRQLLVSSSTSLRSGSRLIYRPLLAATAGLHFVSAKAKVDDWITFAYLTHFSESKTDDLWDAATVIQGDLPKTEPISGASGAFGQLTTSASNAKNYDLWSKMLLSYVYQNQALTLQYDPALKLISSPGEADGAFRVRVEQANREARDLALSKLRDKYAPKLAALNEQIRKAEVRVDREESQYERSKLSTAVSVGSTLLGALLGRKTMSVGSMQRAASTMNRAGGAFKERGDIARAEQDVAAAQQKLADLQAQFDQDAASLSSQFAAVGPFEEIVVRPRKSDITLSDLTVLWTPWQIDSNGIAEAMY